MLDVVQNNIILQKERELIGERAFAKYNKAFVIGKIEEELEFVSEKNKNSYRTKIETQRESGKRDYIPITIPEFLMPVELKVGDYVEVAGELKSYMRYGRKKVFIFVRKITICNKTKETNMKNWNLVYISGCLVDKPYFKDTKDRKIRAISFCVGVTQDNEIMGERDYVHCIAWGDNADLLRLQKIGTIISLYGKIHSRKFPKESNGKIELIEVYDISVIACKIVN